MDQSVASEHPAPPRRRRISRYVTAHMRILVTAMMLMLALGAGMGIDRYLVAGTTAGQSSDSIEDTDQFTILDETYQSIRDNYVLSDDITDEQLIYGAAAGMVEALGDTGHSTFLDPEQARDFEDSSKGELVGIGVQVDTTGSLPVVIAPIAGSPAEAAGILPGDTIVEIDGKSLEGMNPEDATDLIRGDEGTDVTLKLIHQGETEPYEVTITRATIKVEPVSWAMMPNDVAWIFLSQFSSGATEQLKAALRDAKEQGAKGVILDLRNNPGGLVFEAIGVASQFLPNGSPLFQEKGRDGDVKITKAVGSNGEWQEGPLVVLVNNGSASSSELVSSAIQDNGRGTLIGQTTYGTGTVLQPFTLSDGSVALLGIELWLSANGNEIYHVGVKPDTEVANDEGIANAQPTQFDDETVTEAQLDDNKDAQLQSAYDELIKLIDDGSGN